MLDTEANRDKAWQTRACVTTVSFNECWNIFGC